ncbi:MAG: hypothetical protein SangKO_056430 [Sandaracinaceae bacterium]
MSTNALLEIAETTPDHALGRCGGAVLYVWRDATTVRAARRLRQLIAEARGHAADGAGVLLGVVAEAAPPPGADARAALAEVLSGAAGFAHSSALVCEGSGFRASMVRGIVTGLNLIARPPFPHQVSANVPAAAQWLEARTRGLGLHAYRAEAIVSQVAALRAASSAGSIRVETRIRSSTGA